MSRALVSSSKYSPGNMTPEALEALFVGAGREKLLQDVLRRVVASATRDEKHFVLLVGQRGAGKTHFLGVLHHRLTALDVRKELAIAFLNEEEWGVASFLDLLVRILRALAAGGEEDVDRRIDEVREAFERSPERAREIAERSLVEIVGKRTLLVLCENLADLFQGLGDEGQKRLRSLIQERGFLTIVATAQALFHDIQARESPFHGFFTIRKLDALDFETALELLRKKAELDKRMDVVAALATADGRARAKAIHHLARGNPRVYVAMSEFLDRESLDDLVVPFMRMVDDLTPYYQERMRQLTSPQQRKIVDFLCQSPGSVPVKQVASHCLISQQVAAKQLGELAKANIVRSDKRGRETHYEIAEPLMRICVEVKDNRTKYLRVFVEFLRAWFSVRELRGRAESIAGASDRSVDLLHVRIAIEAAERDGLQPLLDSLFTEAHRCIDECDFANASALAARLVDERGEEGDFWTRVHALNRRGEAAHAEAAAREGLLRFPDSVFLTVGLVDALTQLGADEDALNVVRVALARHPNESALLRIRTIILAKLRRDTAVVESTADELRVIPNDAAALEARTWALITLARWGDAEAVARRWIAAQSDRELPYVLLSHVLILQGRTRPALEALDQAASKGLVGEMLTFMRGQALIILGFVREALANAEGWLAHAPSTRLRGQRALALTKLHQFEEAELALREYVEIDPDNFFGYSLLADVLYHQGRLTEALEFTEVSASRSLSERLLPKRIDLLRRSNRFNEALRAVELAQAAEALSSAEAQRLRWDILFDMNQEETIRAELDISNASDPVVRYWRGMLQLLDEHNDAACATWRPLADMRGPDAILPRVWAANALRAAGYIEEALALLDASASGHWNAPLEHGTRAETLLRLGRYPEAREAAIAAGQFGSSILPAAITGEVGLTNALEADLGPLIAQFDPKDALTRMLRIEAKERGPILMARQAHTMTRALEREQRLALWPSILTSLLSTLIAEKALADPAWIEAAALLRESLGQIEGTELPLKGLAAAAEFAATGDRSALLALPLEVRSLIAPETVSDAPP